MKKILFITILCLIVAVPAFAQHGGGAAASSRSGAVAGASNYNNFEGSTIPPTIPEGPALMGPQVQQNNSPTGRDKHFNRTIKPWTIKSCWTRKDLNRITGTYSYNTFVSDKGNVQIFPFEDLTGSTDVYTVIPNTPYSDVIKVYKVLAAGVVFASDSENTYMQQWVKIMKANFNAVGAKYVMVFDEGAKEGSEAFGWNFGLSIGANLVGVSNNASNTGGIGATAGFGVANTQNMSQEYPHLTIVFLDDLKPATKK
jgi:hypothetical protein